MWGSGRATTFWHRLFSAGTATVPPPRHRRAADRGGGGGGGGSEAAAELTCARLARASSLPLASELRAPASAYLSHTRHGCRVARGVRDLTVPVHSVSTVCSLTWLHVQSVGVRCNSNYAVATKEVAACARESPAERRAQPSAETDFRARSAAGSGVLKERGLI